MIYTSRKMKFKKYDYERVTTNTAAYILLYLKLSKVCVRVEGGGGGDGERKKLCDIYINLWLYTKEGL